MLLGQLVQGHLERDRVKNKGCHAKGDKPTVLVLEAGVDHIRRDNKTGQAPCPEVKSWVAEYEQR